MSLHYYTYYSKEKIKIADKPFAAGGEGVLYKIASPRIYRNKIAKIYHHHKTLDEVLPKIKFMIKHQSAELSQSMAFPIDLLMQNNRFVGFIMPFFSGEKLEILCQPNRLAKLNRNWQRFSLHTKQGFENRLHLGFYVASLLSKIHATEAYIVVDFKPENLLVQPNMDLAMVDLDSMQIEENGELLFRAPMVTLEYAPPEFHVGDVVGQQHFKKSWDNFSLAILLYRLFLQVHPYAASSEPPFDSIVNLHGKVEHGLFVHRPDLKDSFRIVPNLHERFHELPSSLQSLFLACFVEGHEAFSKRPTALEWAVALMICIQRYHNKDKLLQQLIIGYPPQVVLQRLPIPTVAYQNEASDFLNKEYELLAEKGWELKKPPAPNFRAHQAKDVLDQGFWLVFLIGFLIQLFRLMAWWPYPSILLAMNQGEYFYAFILGAAAILGLFLGGLLAIYCALYLGHLATALVQTMLSPLFYNSHPVVRQKKIGNEGKIPIKNYLDEEQILKTAIVEKLEETQGLKQKKAILYESMIALRSNANFQLERIFDKTQKRLEQLNLDYMSQASRYLKEENAGALVNLAKTLQEKQYFQKELEAYQLKTAEILFKYKTVQDEYLKEWDLLEAKLKEQEGYIESFQEKKRKHLSQQEKLAIDFDEITLQNYVSYVWQNVD